MSLATVDRQSNSNTPNTQKKAPTGPTLDESQRTAITLRERGFAVLSLRERSKAPIAVGWTTNPVASIDELMATYRRGFNLGSD